MNMKKKYYFSQLKNIPFTRKLFHFRHSDQQTAHHGQTSVGLVRVVQPSRGPRRPGRSHQQETLARSHQRPGIAFLHHVGGLHLKDAIHQIPVSVGMQEQQLVQSSRIASGHRRQQTRRQKDFLRILSVRFIPRRGSFTAFHFGRPGPQLAVSVAAEVVGADERFSGSFTYSSSK